MIKRRKPGRPKGRHGVTVTVYMSKLTAARLEGYQATTGIPNRSAAVAHLLKDHPPASLPGKPKGAKP